MSQLLSDLRAGGGLITAVNGGNNITVNTVAGVATVNVSGTTNHAVQVGNALGALTSIGTGLAGDLLTSNGPGADPSFQTYAPPPVGPLVYAQIYQTGLQDVFAGNYVTFDTNGLIANITHVPGSSVITINNSGLYNIIFWFETDGSFCNVEIHINGAPIPQAKFQGNNAGQWALGEALIPLSIGDTVQFFNTGPNDLFFEADAGKISANVIITKLTTTGSSGTGLLTMNDNSGSANEVAGVMNLVTNNSTFIFTGAGNTNTLDFFQVNSNIGSSLPAITTGTRNTGYGAGVNQDLTSGNDNTTIGYGALVNATTGSQNISVGTQALKLANGDSNTAIGYQSLSFLTSGSNNIGLGFQSGINATTNGSCIYIGHPGVAAESNVQRLGTDGNGVNQVNTTVIAGDVSSVRSFTATAGNITATAGDVVITAGNLQITAATNAGGTQGLISFLGSGAANRLISMRGTGNTFVGYQSGNTTLTTVSAIGNSGFGLQALQALTTGSGNVAVGQAAGTAITTGSNNVALGLDALEFLTTGSNNVVCGASSGTAYTTNESNNILIGEGIAGTLGESNKIRIGNASNNACFITGIDGVNVGSTATVVTEVSNQLGTAVITAGTGISVTPGANTITIANTSMGLAWTVETVNLTATVNHGIIANKAGTLVITLPAVCAIGDVIRVTGINTALGWQIQCGAGQQIFVGNGSTTVAGTITSTAIRDSIEIVCVATNLTFNAISWVGNLTLA